MHGFHYCSTVIDLSESGAYMLDRVQDALGMLDPFVAVTELANSLGPTE